MVRAAGVLGMLLMSLGCRSMPEIHYYTLVVPSSVVVPSSASPSAPAIAEQSENGSGGNWLGVEPFVVDPPYDQGLLVYRLGGDSVEVGFYDYHRWSSPIGSLVAQAFVEGLRGSPNIAGCELAMSERSYAAVLQGRVVYLEEVDAAEGLQARIKLELVLESPDGEPLWRKALTSETRLQADSATQVVDQIRRDLAQMAAESRLAIDTVLADSDSDSDQRAATATPSGV